MFDHPASVSLRSRTRWLKANARTRSRTTTTATMITMVSMAPLCLTFDTGYVTRYGRRPGT
jgi:hypothetical protein